MTDFNEILNDRGRGALDKKMGIEITEASPQRLVGRMPVEGNTQPFG
ncbi:MAG: aromatic compound degradation protein PaaI, partial [Actinobacteria bacterium]|nr:aromatic compound degradation protein PaaI [Actinomycetota bacterium]